MAETLEIQIQDKGGSAASAGPPRAPAAPQTPAPASRPLAPAAPSLAPQKQQPGVAEQFADMIGYGKQFRAIRQFFQSFAQKPAVQPAAAQAAQGAPLAEALPDSLEEGFGRVNKTLGRIADEFAEMAGLTPVVPQQTAEAKVESPAQQKAHAPAANNLRHNPDLDEVFGEAPKPQTPQAPAAPPAHSTAVSPPRPPRAEPAEVQPAAGEAAEAAGAAEGAEVAAGAEAAGVGLAGIAVAAAPVAAGLLAVYAAVKLTEAAFDAVHVAADVAGQQLSMLAKNNYAGMLTAGLDTATRAVSKIPIVGGLLGSAFGAATASVKAFTSVVGAFNERASELAAFSPEIMMAQQRQAIGSLMGDIKEAQTLGPDLAHMLDAETALQHDLREMFLPVKKIIVEVLADVLEKVRDALPDIAKGTAALLDGVNVVIAILDGMSLHVLHGLAAPIEKILSQVADSLRKIKVNTDPKQEINDIFLNDLFADRDWNFNGGDPWQGIDGDPRPHIPIVGGFGGL